MARGLKTNSEHSRQRSGDCDGGASAADNLGDRWGVLEKSDMAAGYQSSVDIARLGPRSRCSPVCEEGKISWEEMSCCLRGGPCTLHTQEAVIRHRRYDLGICWPDARGCKQPERRAGSWERVECDMSPKAGATPFSVVFAVVDVMSASKQCPPEFRGKVGPPAGGSPSTTCQFTPSGGAQRSVLMKFWSIPISPKQSRAVYRSSSDCSMVSRHAASLTSPRLLFSMYSVARRSFLVYRR